MKWFLLIISSIVVFTFFFFPVTDFDIWFHLADGKFMVENHRFPATDVYSYTAYGQPVFLNSWLFDPLVYLVFKFFGINGLNLVKAICALAVFLLITAYLYRQKLLNAAVLLFVVLAMFSIRSHFSLRPQTLSYLLFAIFWLLLFKYQETRESKYIGFLALLQFLWVNSHSSFTYGIIFSGVFLVAELITKKKINKKNLVLVGLLLLTSCLHLFYGPDFFIRTIKAYLTSISASPIREYYPPTLLSYLSIRGLVLLSIFPTLYFSFRKKQFSLLLSLVLLVINAVRSERFMAELIIFLCLTAPLYFPLISQLVRNLFKRLKLKLKLSPTILFVAILLALFVVVKNSQLGIGFGLEKFVYPERAVEFIKKTELLKRNKGNLYNTYNFGGYLIWNLPEHKVFVDGRMQPYVDGIFDNYWNNFESGKLWEETVKKYNIIAALMTLPHTDGKTIYNDSTKMFPKDDWALIYYDDVAMIYIRRIPELKGFVDKLEYQLLNPQAMDFSYFQETLKTQADFEKALAETKRGLEINPQSYRLHFTLSYLYTMGNRQDLTRQELQKTLEINPWFKPAHIILDSLLTESTEPLNTY